MTKIDISESANTPRFELTERVCSYTKLKIMGKFLLNLISNTNIEHANIKTSTLPFHKDGK
jgi:hypothetical protein